MSRRNKLFGAFAGALLVLGAGTVVAYQVTGGSSGTLARTDEIGGPIDLIAQDGKAFSNADLKGQPFAIFFGFTRCPNVCPTTLSDLTLDLDDLGPLADRMKVLFVSVDPERDNPASMKDYLSAFDPRIIGLSGTPEQIATLAKAYRVFYEKVPTPGGDYTMNHTASVYLMDADGKFTGTINFQEERSTQLAKLKRLASGTGAST
ncbi:SCO family protein [Kaistia dalseonensis]|uniref:Protein SCO1/2 n=1 Tax=Kaistia dalseonensis TaxID=410840 RepID=A0ABU0HBI8_9HYPH|nr:SCO family protein [Kaistia dalseonensis]MCX5496266.1 SCO family protein [Kaistia dalseonensis]MDQ0438884.1 protein SCO1/2 [Kaistia dalseonensis]